METKRPRRSPSATLSFFLSFLLSSRALKHGEDRAMPALLAEPAMTEHASERASDSSRKSRLPVLSISANRFPFYLFVIVETRQLITRITYDYASRPMRDYGRE